VSAGVGLSRPGWTKDGLMQTVERFLVANQIRMRCHEVAVGADHGLLITPPWGAKHYECELYGSGGHRPVTTIMASDDGPPDVTEVLDAVAAEAAVIEETTCYEEWAGQMGFDPDSRHGERVYRSEGRQARLLLELLGDEDYRALLWEIERL
jgi:hypothetical protein